MNTGSIRNLVVLPLLTLLMIVGGCVSGNGTDEKADGMKPSSDVDLLPGTYTGSVLFDPTAEIEAKQFESEDEFRSLLGRTQAQHVYYAGFSDDLRLTGPAGPPGAPAPMPIPTPMPAPVESVNKSFSETNVQVAGIDEADIIKTDGEYIYTISGNTVFIIKAYPGEDAEVVATIEYDENTPAGLFVKDDHLAVFGSVYDYDFPLMDTRRVQGMTFFEVYDISDHSRPELVRQYDFEGYYSHARMKDGYVYFVIGQWTDWNGPVPLPVWYRDAVEVEMPVKDIYYFDIPYRSPQVVTVHAINIGDPADEAESKAVVVEGSQNLYMSHENIFITYTEYVDEYELQNEILKNVMDDRLTEDDRILIEKIKATDDDVLSQYEKDNKIMQVYQNRLSYLPRQEQDEIWDEVEELLRQKLEEYEYFEYTVIHRIKVDDGAIEVKESGKVPGHIMNQFSLDEDTAAGVLRIATTVSGRWSRFGHQWNESSNNVYALNARMEIIGKLEGLAETEQIYSTRFIGDKLYMVTFRQVDPFFVIDLSDPTDITELGELKIPGFSRYLHPYDENTIIGIGQEATSTGRTTGLKISLFDVSDFENPKEIAKWVSEERYSDSTALYEHKAFLFDQEKELLVIPGYSCYWERGRERGFNGAMVFRITREDIDLRGVIDHSGRSGDCYDAQVERSLWIEDLLYTKSLDLLKVNQIADLADVAEVELHW